MADPKIVLTAVDQTRAAFDSVKSGLGTLETKALAVTGALTALSTGAALVGLIGGLHEAINEWDELGKAAQRAGFQSAQGIAEFQYAAKLAGVDSAGFETAVGKLSEKMAEAAGGGEKAAAMFAAMGLKIKDSTGNLRATEDVVTDLAKAFAGWKDGPEKSALALELFGKQGKQLIPLLNGGADGLAKLRGEFQQLGGVYDDRVNKGAEQFNDNLTKLGVSAGALKRELAENMLPGLNQITDAMVEQAKKGSTLLTIWAGLKEFGKLALGVDETKSTKAQLDLLEESLRVGGDSGGKLQAKIDQLRSQLFNTPAIQQAAAAAEAAYYGTTAKPAAPITKDPSAAAKESAYAAVNKTVMERLALQKQELTAGRELTDVEKLESKALEDLNHSKVAVTDAERKDIQAKLDKAKANEIAIKVTKSEYDQAMAAAKERQRLKNEGYDEAKKADDAETARQHTAATTLAQIEFETSLIGLNNQQREVAIALHDLELQGITKGTKAYDTYAASIAQAVSKRAGLNESVENFKSMWQSIDSTAHDVWTNIWEGGSNVFKKLGQTLKASLLDMLYQMVVKRWVFNIFANVTGAAANGVAQAAGNSIGGSLITGAGGNMLGNYGSTFMSGAGSEIMNGTLLGNVAAGYAGVGGSFASTVGAGLATDAMGATVAEGTAAATIGSGSAVGAGLAAIPVYGWIALAALAAYEMMKGGETRVGGQYSGTSLISAPSGGQINGDATTAAIGVTIGETNALLKALGSTASVTGFQSGLEQSENGKGFAYARGSLSTGQNFGNWAQEGYMQNRGSMTAQEAAAKFSEELKQATLEALHAADVPGKLGEWLKSLGDIDQLSGGALDAALARINKALGEKQQLEDKYFELTHTAAEVLARDRDRERSALDESNQALYDQVAALTDQKAATEASAQAIKDSLTTGLTDATTALVQARNAESDAIKSSISNLESSASRLRSFATDIRNFRDGLLTSDLSPLTPQQQYEQARQIAVDTYNRALGGDQSAMDQIQTVAENFLRASQVYNASGSAYQNDFATVQTYLTIGASKADEAASWAEAQTTILNAQLSALGTINTSVLTVAQAMTNLRAAGASAIAGGVMPSDDTLRTYLTSAIASGDKLGAYTALQASNRTMAQGDVLLAMQPGEIEAWAQANNLPQYANGTDYVPRTGIALVHQGESITPQRFNSASGATASEALMRELVAEVRALREQQVTGVRAQIAGGYDASNQVARKIEDALDARATWERALILDARPT
jgi:hypothetical protein